MSKTQLSSRITAIVFSVIAFASLTAATANAAPFSFLDSVDTVFGPAPDSLRALGIRAPGPPAP